MATDSVTTDKEKNEAKSETAKKAPIDDSFTEIKRKAEAEDAEAQFKFGGLYANGKGVERNDTEAVKWFRHSANQK